MSTTISELAKRAAQLVGAGTSHVKPQNAQRLLNSRASNRQSAWAYGVKVKPKKPKDPQDGGPNPVE